MFIKKNCKSEKDLNSSKSKNFISIFKYFLKIDFKLISISEKKKKRNNCLQCKNYINDLENILKIIIKENESLEFMIYCKDLIIHQREDLVSEYAKENKIIKEKIQNLKAKLNKSENTLPVFFKRVESKKKTEIRSNYNSSSQSPKMNPSFRKTLLPSSFFI